MAAYTLCARPTKSSNYYRRRQGCPRVYLAPGAYPILRTLNNLNTPRSPYTNPHALLSPSPSLPHTLSSRDSLDAVVHALLQSHAFCVTAIVGV